VSAAPQFFEVPVESLEFGKKCGFGEIGIEYAYGIVRVQGGYQGITGGLDGL
jgi:hypothetical protein